MLSLQTIKQVLVVLGVNKLTVKFDCATKQIITTHESACGRQCNCITFEAVEKLFSDSQGADSSIESPHSDKPAYL
jgi:hypothetical protein